MRLNEFLDSHHVNYQRLPHWYAVTANRVAQTLHVKGRDMAKTVLIWDGDDYMLLVLPANRQVDLPWLRRLLNNENVTLATEQEMEQIFPECDRGAMPPFGSLYHLTTLVDESLAKDKEFVFEGENHEEAYRMSYHDYVQVEHPRLQSFSCIA